MDILKDCFLSFAYGFSDSLRGFLPLSISSTRSKSSSGDKRDVSKRSVSSEKPPNKSDSVKSPLTNLEIRRRQEREGRSLSKKRKLPEEIPSKPPHLWTRVAQIGGMNVCLILVFYWLFVPIVSFLLRVCSLSTPHPSSIGPSNLSNTLGMFFILPLFMFTRLWNCLWFQDVANAASSEVFRDPRVASSVPVSLGVADFCVSFLLELAFLGQSYLVALFPLAYVSNLATYVHFCLLYALYSFEYPWMSCGIELSSRLQRLQRNWLYFVGFGTPLALLTCLPYNFIINGCLFGVFFPVFIVSSCRARPPPPPPSLTPCFVFTPSLYVVNRVSKYLASCALR